MFTRASVLTLAASLALLLVPPAGAEEWKYDLEIYLLGAGLDGTAGAGPLEAEVDVSFGDILDNLELGAMGTFRAKKGRWAFLGDAVFMGLGASNDLVDVDVDQLVLEALGVYHFNDKAGVLFGARYVDIENQIDFRGPLGGRVRGGEDVVVEMII